jgi:hypothetical protein
MELARSAGEPMASAAPPPTTYDLPPTLSGPCLLPTAYCFQPTANCLLPTVLLAALAQARKETLVTSDKDLEHMGTALKIL